MLQRISISLVLILVAFHVKIPFIDRRLQQAPLPPSPPTKPNILLLMLDQWRYDWDGLHPITSTGPLPLKMPFLQSVAGKGTRFPQTYVPSPLCGPVRACLASGKEYDFAGVMDNHPNTYPLDQTTFYKLLRDVGGYHVMSAGKDDLYQKDAAFPYFPGSNPHLPTWDIGFSAARRTASKTRVLKEVSNFDLFRDYLERYFVTTMTDSYRGLDVFKDCFDGNFNPGTKCLSDTFTDELYPDDYVRDLALDLLQEKPDGKPWFLQVNFPGPHPPIFVTADMAESVKDRTWPPPVDSLNVAKWQCPAYTGQPQNGGRCNYGGELERLDGLMREIVRKVEETSSNTLICITGDHGEMLGDHSVGGKKVPWQPSISVPLVCMGTGVQAGKAVQTPVTTLDLPGTFLDLAGVPPAPKMTTQSLRNALYTPNMPVPRQTVHTGLDNWRAVIQSIAGVSYKLVCCIGVCPSAPTGTPPPERGWTILLYDTQSDPDDLHSLHLQRPGIVTLLRAQLPKGWCPDTQNIPKPPPLASSQ